jgi:hypothetical protein
MISIVVLLNTNFSSNLSKDRRCMIIYVKKLIQMYTIRHSIVLTIIPVAQYLSYHRLLSSRLVAEHSTGDGVLLRLHDC